MANLNVSEANQWYDDTYEDYKLCNDKISRLLEDILKSANIPYHSITNRVKEKDSFLKKCDNKYNNNYNKIMDMSGIRIIAYTLTDVKEICNIIEKEFDIDNINSLNKSDNIDTDRVGYLSVHYITKLNNTRINLPEFRRIKNITSEIQVRTLLQHTWAEIEHDKSYKFSGELRKDLKRRFFLIAGVLELMDHEFEKLSDEIDMYATEVKNKTKDGNFFITIDSTSLQEYMINKYGNLNDEPGNTIDRTIIDELKMMGLTTLKDIEDIIVPEYIIPEDSTYYGILRDMMIIHDASKYFKEVYKLEWTITHYDIDLYKSYGINVFDYIDESIVKKM